MARNIIRVTRLRLLLGALLLIQYLFIWAVVRSRESIVDKELCDLNDNSLPVGQSSGSVSMTEIPNTMTSSKIEPNATTTTMQKNATTTTKKPNATSTKKPIIDMVNDYQPFVDFKFVFPEIIPDIKGARDYFLIVLVNSAAKGNEYRKRRDNIRQTWASSESCEQLKAMNNSKLRHLKWKVVFVLGKAGRKTDDDKLNAEEARKYNDILIGNIHDNYLNNIIKFYMAQLWASTFSSRYTLKTDDDTYVRIPKLIEYLANESFPSRFYGGSTYHNGVVNRWAGGKWSISKKYFEEDVWPPFNAGAFIILSTDLLEKLFNYVYIRKPFHTDDAYVGVAMRDFKVNVTNISSFDIKNNMAQLIREKNRCEILALIAFGHNIDPESSNILHSRLDSMCKKRNIKYC